MLVIFLSLFSYNFNGEKMKKNFKIFAINFDTKVKILVIICIFIALVIISYSFWYICLSEQKNEPVKKIEDIESILEFKGYEAKYNVTVNGNKTTNIYTVKENVDFENGIYEMAINDNLVIYVSNDEIKIKKQDMQYEYNILNNNELLKNNAIAFSSVIECIRKIKDGDISGNVKRIEQNDKYVYQITTENEYINKISKIDVIIPKNNCKISEIKMYNEQDLELYLINIESFLVKK